MKVIIRLCTTFAENSEVRDRDFLLNGVESAANPEFSHKFPANFGAARASQATRKK